MYINGLENAVYDKDNLGTNEVIVSDGYLYWNLKRRK
jgi:hypothetical protein